VECFDTLQLVELLDQPSVTRGVVQVVLQVRLNALLKFANLTIFGLQLFAELLAFPLKLIYCLLQYPLLSLALHKQLILISQLASTLVDSELDIVQTIVYDLPLVSELGHLFFHHFVIKSQLLTASL